MPYDVKAFKIDGGYKIYLVGKPVAWAAPRVTKRGVYDTKWQEKRDAYLLLKSLNLRQLQPPVSLKIIFQIRMPEGWSKKKKEKMNVSWRINKPDLCNYQKLLCDTLEKAGIVENDSNIVKIESSKINSYDDETVIEIVTIKENL